MEICRLIVLGSSSQGNGYLLDANGEQLIIECGAPAKEMFNLLDWRIDRVAACICSHRTSQRPLSIHQTIPTTRINGLFQLRCRKRL